MKVIQYIGATQHLLLIVISANMEMPSTMKRLSLRQKETAATNNPALTLGACRTWATVVGIVELHLPKKREH